MKEIALKHLFHPLAINSSRHWFRLVRSYGGVAPKCYLRAAVISALSPLSAPLRLQENLVYGKRIRTAAIAHPPIFIVGHWRSGTTHLHYLLSQDPQLGFLSTFQTMIPGAYLSSWQTVRRLMALFLPEKRPMDNMALSVDLPQEDEYAMCNLSALSPYLGGYFPNHGRHLFRQFGLLEGISDSLLEQWRQTYLQVIKKATFCAGGRRLVLKNPVNTGRLCAVRSIFPGAKFIHIYRDPYVVFKSTQKLHHEMRDLIALQPLSDDAIEDNVLFVYREVMTRFFEQKDTIPPGHLAEVRFEDLEQRPLEELHRIYAQLGLNGWETAREPIARYLATLEGYQKNRFPMSRRDIGKVEEHWGFALDRWGYPRPEIKPA